MNNDQLTLEMVARRARREFAHREVVSLIDGRAVTQTYRELFERVDRLAWALRSLGIVPGDRVGTMAWNHHRHLELYLAVALSGAVLHTVNVRLSGPQAVEVVRHAGDKVVFVDADLGELLDAVAERAPEVDTVVRLGGSSDSRSAVLDYEDLLAAQPSEPYDYPALTEDMPAATSYSSATTGTPKGVVYTHRALLLHSMMLGLKDTWAISESDTILPIVPMFHVNAWGLPFTALWMGSRLVLPGERPAAAALLELMRCQRVTFAAAVPTVWMGILDLVEDAAQGLPDLRMVVSGGAPLPRALLQRADRLEIPMIHSYGMTEASPLVLVGQGRSDAPTERDDRIKQRLRQGYVVPGLDFRVVDDAGKPVPWDGASPGELLLAGPWIAEEYERDERTAAAFVDGWYRSGDIVTVDPHGYLQVVDRLSDLIKSGGEWISTIELEDALMDHPKVSAAAVIGVPDERWSERPCAYVVAESGLAAEELRSYLAERFPRFWVPEEIHLTDAIPVTTVGKFDKKALKGLRHG